MSDKAPPSSDDDVSFGFRAVPRNAKQGLVREVFDSVAESYDVMNDLMSAGVHRLWKDAAIAWLRPQPGQSLIDVAGGTGDMALRFLQAAEKKRRRRGGRAASAVICDINFDMLHAGAGRKDIQRFLDDHKGEAEPGPALARVCGNAEALPAPADAFDAYTIAFGIRNVTDRAAALAEAKRVLRPGGRFLCLEFSHPTTEALQALYDAYSFQVIPRLGEAVAKDKASYEYLVESIRRFPPQKPFAEEIEAAGFTRVTWRNLSGGVAALHSGWKI